MHPSFKKYIPHLTAMAIFIAITLIHFYPLLFGKSLAQPDIVAGISTAHEINEYRRTQNNEALWTNSLFSGMPAYQISTKYPGNWLSAIDDIFHLHLPAPSGYIFLGFLGFFILLLCLDVTPWVALVGA